MIDPTVCAIMLTRDRPEYSLRAVECFRAQTYDKKSLLIFDTGAESIASESDWDAGIVVMEGVAGRSIGRLRNDANSQMNSDIIIHWDDDDWSHPNRIAEQVALLQSSGKDCVGYRELLFWKNHFRIEEFPTGSFLGIGVPAPEIPNGGEAWLYSNGDIRTCVGTSLCYWRKTWEQHPFREKNGANPRERGEDREFVRQVNSLGVSSFGPVLDIPAEVVWQHDGYKPRMIARIHAGNAHHYTVRNAPWWTREPEWDKHCTEVMG